MNRDDLTSRPEAPPSVWPGPDPSFVAPRDLQACGTWVGVNAHGIIACLLNRYDDAAVGTRSRGDVVVGAMRGASIDESCHRLTALEQARLPALGDLMLTSSSWSFATVKQQRETLFERTWAERSTAEDRLTAFHCHREADGDRWTPMMHREHSETKSVTQIELQARGAEMRYWARLSALARGLTLPDISLQIAAA